jgi:hypothetical protein
MHFVMGVDVDHRGVGRERAADNGYVVTRGREAAHIWERLERPHWRLLITALFQRKDIDGILFEHLSYLNLDIEERCRRVINTSQNEAIGRRCRCGVWRKSMGVSRGFSAAYGQMPRCS